MSPRTLVILNPRSRSGATGRQWGALVDGLRHALGPFEVEPTRGPRDAERIAREGVRAGIERILVAGGDGTTGEVVSGLLGADLGGCAQLGLLPLGTGGDLMRTLGLPRKLEDAVARLVAGRTRRLDAGRVTYRGRDGREATAHYLNVASVGISGLVDELVNRAPKQLGGTVSFLLGTLRALVRYRPLPVVLRADGEAFYEGPLVVATAANGRYFGGGMHVAPGARPDDGLLDVVVVPGVSKLHLLRRLPALYRGTHLGDPLVVHRRARTLEVDGEPGSLWLDVDGEPLGTLPARFEVLPGAINWVGAGP